MNEIRTEQLAFSEEEAKCLLNEKMGLDIGPEDLCVLLERTEGWPAGIYLASLSLQNKEDKHAFIASFRGSNRYIVGLLGEEVLAGLPEEVRQFLLETSVLRTMTGPLCDAVTGREGSTRLLRELVQHRRHAAPGGVAEPAGGGSGRQKVLDQLVQRRGVGADVGFQTQVTTGQHDGHPMVAEVAAHQDLVARLDQTGRQAAARRYFAHARRRDVDAVGRSGVDHLGVARDD
jgi:hypothetical protein